jgi:hypothetical protein
MFNEDEFNHASVNLDAPIPAEAGIEGTGVVKDVFCDHWSKAKTGLWLLKASVKNGLVRIAIKWIIRIGDRIHGEICEPTKEEEKLN